MVDYEKLKKFVNIFLKTRPIVFGNAFNLLFTVLFWTVATMGVQWMILSVPAITLDQFITFICALYLSIIWTFPGNRFMQIASEIIGFIVGEMAVLTTMALSGAWVWNFISQLKFVGKDIFVPAMSVALNIGFLLMVSLMNTIIHSILIVHLIRKTERTVAKYTAAVRLVFCVLGLIMLYGSIFLTFGLSKKIDLAFICVLTMQTGIVLLVFLTVHDLKCGSEGKEVQKWFRLSSRYIVILVLLPLVISAVIIASKYGVVKALTEVKDFVKTEVAFVKYVRKAGKQGKQPDVKWFEFTSRMLSFVGCFMLFFARSAYLKTTVETVTATKPEDASAASHDLRKLEIVVLTPQQSESV